jgi:hypothetical protein
LITSKLPVTLRFQAKCFQIQHLDFKTKLQREQERFISINLSAREEAEDKAIIYQSP